MSSFTEQLEYKPTQERKNGRKVYEITKEFTYAVGSLEQPLYTIKVPVGFKTDLASIPRVLSWLFRPNGPWAKAAVVHDYLYEAYKHINRITSDTIFLEALLVTGVNPFIAHAFYLAVRLFNQYFAPYK